MLWQATGLFVAHRTVKFLDTMWHMSHVGTLLGFWLPISEGVEVLEIWITLDVGEGLRHFFPLKIMGVEISNRCWSRRSASSTGMYSLNFSSRNPVQNTYCVYIRFRHLYKVKVAEPWFLVHVLADEERNSTLAMPYRTISLSCSYWHWTTHMYPKKRSMFYTHGTFFWQ